MLMGYQPAPPVKSEEQQVGCVVFVLMGVAAVIITPWLIAAVVKYFLWVFDYLI